MDPMLEFNSKVPNWREKALRGELTQDEMREAVMLLRQIRGALPEVGAAKAPAKGKAKPKAKPNGDDLLNELGI